MKFKIFTGTKSADVEKDVNAWLEREKAIVRTSGCSMMQIPGPFVSVPTVMVTVFYEEAGAS